MKFYALVAYLTLMSSVVFGQIDINVNEESNPALDNIVAEFNFCLPLVEKTDSLIILKCGPVKMEIERDAFHGEMTFIITPNKEDGPITEKTTMHWYLLPEKKDSTNIEIQSF